MMDIYKQKMQGVHGLNQEAFISYNQLVQYMYKYWNYPIPFTTDVWAHRTQRTKFFLFVDDFRVKYFHNSES